jgi:hypothetical protein
MGEHASCGGHAACPFPLTACLPQLSALCCMFAEYLQAVMRHAV